MRILKYIFIVVYGLLVASLLYWLVITDGLTRTDYILMIVFNIAGLIIVLRESIRRKKKYTK